MMSAVSIALPEIQREFAAHAVLLSWIATSYILASAVFLVPFGKLADIYGRKRIYATGLALFSLSTLAAGLVGSAQALIVVRIVQGLGGAMIMTTGVAILTSVFPATERGKVLGINVAAVYTGLSAGPFIGGLLTQQLGWRYVFLTTAPLPMIAFLLAITMLKDEWADAKGDRFDLVGSVYFGLSLTSLLYGASLLPSASAAGLIILGLVGFAVFIRRQTRISHPVFEVRLFRDNRTFSLSNLAAFIHYAATFGVTFLLSLYLQYIKGMSPQEAGLVLLFQPVMMAVFSPFAGRLSDRIEPRILASAGMAITSIGLVVLTFVGENTPTVYIAATLAFMGSGYGLFSSPNTNAIMSSVDRRYYGIASGAVSTMRTVGMSVSMAIVTVIFAVLIGKAEIQPENYPVFSHSVKLLLTIFAVICAVGILPSMSRGKIRN
jgi:EmrB/QacA subfamily drug resistance transporter